MMFPNTFSRDFPLWVKPDKTFKKITHSGTHASYASVAGEKNAIGNGLTIYSSTMAGEFTTCQSYGSM